MKAYRRHFVRLNLMLVGAVLLVALVLALGHVPASWRIAQALKHLPD